MDKRMEKKKVIAFYLPQFHAIPENDRCWGKGFTEWTNSKKAVPLFDWHEQPKIPLDQDYYDLSDVNVMIRQSEMAKKYGIYGFCYYHYWFKDGKKLLEKPVEQMLDEPKVDIPFCLSWANENWTKNWDGGNREIIVEQDYGSTDEWRKHFDYLLKFFKDKRYIVIDNCPLLIIYRPELIPCFNDMVKLFKKLAVEAGFDGLIVASQYPEINQMDNRYLYKIDYFIKFQPGMSWCTKWSTDQKVSIKRKIKRSIIKSKLARMLFSPRNNNTNTQTAVKKKKELEVFDYDELWDLILNKESFSKEMISGGFTGWDNTARNKNGMIVKGSTPEKFGKYLSELLKKPSGMNMVFINAWNEWAEGAYLEPDERYGYAYLEELKKSVDGQGGSYV